MTQKIEHIEPFIRPPWWKLKAKVFIEQKQKISKSAAFH
jgi:hypothetical protein